ncbi:MAG TPA: hypothetical protein PKE63_03900 [Lacibacter sp.]|nr:hypothetical protein [Lacibacter sp.]HMO89579.1 hypothetical protein [Lacibacter sp.]HMP86394.1 hypothetical protein [Lacibacter sp.]
MKTTVLTAFLSLLLFYCSDTQARVLPSSVVSTDNWPLISSWHCTRTNTHLQLQWTATSEAADVVYVVEKSANGKDFTTAAVLLGGFSIPMGYSYQFKEKYSGNASYTYRIKQVRSDGTWRIAGEQTL